MLRPVQFITGIVFMIFIEVLNVNHSRGATNSDAAHFVINNINYLRLVGFLMIFYPVIYYFKFGNRTSKFAIAGALLVYLLTAILYK